MTNKVALITGAAHRLGATIAKKLHQRGYRIIVHYGQSIQAAQQLVEQCNQQRENSALCLQANLEQLTDINQLADNALAHWGRVDALINNASSFYPTPAETVNEEQWDQLLSSNLKGAFFLSQALIPSLKKYQGSITNIIDIHSDKPLNNYPVYSIAKAGLAMMTKTLAKELAPDIRVNGVSPGAILWPEHETSEQAKQNILDKIPLQRIGNPDDIANTVAFLVDESPYISGQILTVDGGRSLNM